MIIDTRLSKYLHQQKMIYNNRLSIRRRWKGKVMRKQVVHWLDTLGFSLSFLCAIHCVLFPLLIIALPLIGLSFLLDSFYEKMFLTFSLILASISLILGYLTHKSFKAIKIYFIASSFLLIGMYGLGHTHTVSNVDHHSEEVALNHDDIHGSEGHGHGSDAEHGHHDSHADKSAHAHDHSHHKESAHDSRSIHGPYDFALILMILGGIALAISHFVNRKLCLSCPAHQHDGHCSHS